MNLPHPPPNSLFPHRGRRPAGDFLRVFLLAAGLLAAGCGGSSYTAKNRPTTAYVDRTAVLFDDGIDPAAAGLDVDSSATPQSDKLFRERTQLADGVFRVKAETISQAGDGASESYRITLKPRDTLGGKWKPSEDFLIVVARTNPSFGIVKHLDARLVGKTFIAFVQAFSTEDGGYVYHAHLAADTKEVAAAVADAYALGEIGK